MSREFRHTMQKTGCYMAALYRRRKRIVLILLFISGGWEWDFRCELSMRSRVRCFAHRVIRGNGIPVSHELSCWSRILFQIGGFLSYCCNTSKKERPGGSAAGKFEKGSKFDCCKFEGSKNCSFFSSNCPANHGYSPSSDTWYLGQEFITLNSWDIRMQHENQSDNVFFSLHSFCTSEVTHRYGLSAISQRGIFRKMQCSSYNVYIHIIIRWFETNVNTFWIAAREILD